MQHTLFDLGRAQLPPSVLAFASGVNEAREIRAFFLCAKSSTRSGTVSSLIDAIVVGGVVGPGAVTALLPTMRHHRIHHARGFLVASSGMEITQGQKDVRDTFLGGFAGQLVSAVLWGASAAACTWHSLHLAEMILVLGGILIFPLTQLVLRSMGHAYGLPKGHPMNALGMQVAFTLPLTLPVIIAIAVLRPAWFYPAFMIVLGAHYLPFVFMYGMWQFAGLCAILVASGTMIAMYMPHPVSLGGWITAALLLAFAFVGRHVGLQEEAKREDRSC